MTREPTYSTHRSWCRALERLGLLDPDHFGCTHSATGACVAPKQRPLVRDAS